MHRVTMRGRYRCCASARDHSGGRKIPSSVASSCSGGTRSGEMAAAARVAATARLSGMPKRPGASTGDIGGDGPACRRLCMLDDVESTDGERNARSLDARGSARPGASSQSSHCRVGEAMVARESTRLISGAKRERRR